MDARWIGASASDPPARGRRARRRICASCQRGFEVAAVGLEQAGEQPVRAPIFEPVLGPVAAEPDLEIAELVEHRGAQEQRATVDWIPLTSCDGERGRAGVVVGPLLVLGYEGLAHQPAQVDLDWAQHGELEVEEGDQLAV